MTSFPRDTILGLLATAALGLAPASVALAVGPKAEGRQALLAWIRFVDGEETYADVPYFWPGKVDLRLQTAKADRRYTVANLGAGSEASFSGSQLQEGMPVQIEPGKELRLTVGLATE